MQYLSPRGESRRVGQKCPVAPVAGVRKEQTKALRSQLGEEAQAQRV